MQNDNVKCKIIDVVIIIFNFDLSFLILIFKFYIKIL